MSKSTTQKKKRHSKRVHLIFSGGRLLSLGAGRDVSGCQETLRRTYAVQPQPSKTGLRHTSVTLRTVCMASLHTGIAHMDFTSAMVTSRSLSLTAASTSCSMALLSHSVVLSHSFVIAATSSEVRPKLFVRHSSNLSNC